MRSALLTLLYTALSGCAPVCRPPAEPPRPTSGSEQADAGHEGSDAGGASAPDESGPPIGFAAIPAPPSVEAIKANKAGLRHHAKGDYAASLRGFDAAIKASADFDMARYNRACALSRLGRLEEAGSELEALLARDLPTFAPRLASDEDLAPLRGGEAWEALRAEAERLGEAWRRALAEGVPAVTYDLIPLPSDGAQVGEVPGRVRAGAYLHEARRFVPSAPTGRAVWAADYDAGREVAVTVSGAFATGDLWVVHMRPLVLDVYDLHEPGRRISHLRVDPIVERFVIAHPREAHDGSLIEAFGLHPEESGVTVAFEDLPLHAPGGRRGTFLLAGDELRHVDGDPEPSGAGYFVGVYGAYRVEPSPEGFSLRGNALHLPGGGEPIELGRGHGRAVVGRYSPASARSRRDVLVSPDGAVAVVVSVYHDCEGGPAHVVDHVVLGGRRVTRLAAADGAAAERFGRDGTLFVQSGRRMLRLAPGSSAAEEDVMPGVLLTLPRFAIDCSI